MILNYIRSRQTLHALLLSCSRHLVSRKQIAKSAPRENLRRGMTNIEIEMAVAMYEGRIMLVLLFLEGLGAICLLLAATRELPTKFSKLQVTTYHNTQQTVHSQTPLGRGSAELRYDLDLRTPSSIVLWPWPWLLSCRWWHLNMGTSTTGLLTSKNFYLHRAASTPSRISTLKNN